MKIFNILIIVLSFFYFANIIHAGGVHVIVYPDHLEDQAKDLAEHLNGGPVEEVDAVQLVPLEKIKYFYQYLVDHGRIDQYWPPEIESGYKTFWDDNGSTPAKLIAYFQGVTGKTPGLFPLPAFPGMGKALSSSSDAVDGQVDDKTVKYVTLFGNEIDIPPSYCTNIDPYVEANNKNTDFWYSLRNFEDFIPDHSISRVPLSINDPTNQIIEINGMQTHGMISGNAGTHTHESLVNLPLGYLSGSSILSYPYMMEVIENTGTDASGNTHILYDDLRPNTNFISETNGYDVHIDSVTQAYVFITYGIKELAIRPQEDTVKFDKIVWRTSSGNLTGPAAGFAKIGEEPMPFGSKTVMLEGYEEEKVFAGGVAFSDEVHDTKATTIHLTKGKVKVGDKEVNNKWPDFDDTLNYVIEVESGKGENNFYIPKSWNTSGNAVTITLMHEGEGDSPGALGKDSFLKLYTVPDFNVIPEDADISRVHSLIPPLEKPMNRYQPHTYIYNNRGVADGFVDKFIAYSNGLASGDDEFADKILFGSNRSYSGLWVFENEQRTVDLINLKSPSLDGGQRSLFNGFHIYKGFETNSDNVSDLESPMARFSWLTPMNFTNQISGKGFAALNDDWIGVIGQTESVEESVRPNPFESPSIFEYKNLINYIPKTDSPHLSLLTSDVLEYFPRYNLCKILNPFHGKGVRTIDRVIGTSYEQEMLLYSSGSSAFHVDHELMNGEYAGFIAAFGHNRQGTSERFIDEDSLGTDNLAVINGKVDIGSFFTNEILHHGIYTSYAEYGKTDPHIGDLWKGAFLHLYDEYRRKHNKKDLSDREVAEELIEHVKGFVSLGVAGMRLPIRRDWQTPERNVPEISIQEEQLRGFKNGKLAAVSYDSDGLPIFSVKDGQTKTINFNIEDDGINTYRVTLFSPQLMTTMDNDSGLNKIKSLDESLLTSEHVSYSQEITGTEIEFDFHENWELISGNIQRGPGVYMLKVEALEPDRSHEESLSETAREAHYFKEARLIFKVVNEFKEITQVPFLLVDNIQRDQFNIRTNGQSVVSPNLRYYEAALDNYQYTRGHVQVDLSNSDNTHTKFIAVNPDINSWGELSGSDNLQRIAVGDKIKVLNVDNYTYSPWFRISSTMHSDDRNLDGIEIEDDQNYFASGNFERSRYIIQRSFTEGYAARDITIDPETNKKVFSDEISLYDDQGGVSGNSLFHRKIIRVGDWFKFCDEGTYRQIKEIDAESAKLTLGEKYPTVGLYTAYEASVYPSVLDEDTYKGSYAIYPDQDGQPSYNYRTWRINNFNLTNDHGQGLHGELDNQSLLEYSQGLSGKYRVVIWASDSVYEQPTFESRFLVLPSLNLLNYDYFLFSPKHKDFINGFLNAGGRLFTASQFLTTTIGRNDTHGYDPHFFESNPEFYENFFGLQEQHDDQSYIFSLINNGLTAILNKENDIISGDINELKLTGGLTANTQKNIDEESSGLGSRNTNLSMHDNANSVPFITYDPASSGGGTTPDSDFIAGVRMSDGPDSYPFATVLLGFDFGAITQSGSNNKDKEGELELRIGRNFLMKQSIDYLRDPTRTSSEDQLQITYYAQGNDTDEDLVSIDLPKEPVINVRQEHLANGLNGGIYMGGQLRFSATGGKIFDKDKYTWTLTSRNSGSGTKPYIGQNEGDTQVVTDSGDELIYFCGDKPGVDLLRVEGPDGSVKVLEIKVGAPELSLKVVLENDVVQTGSLPKIQAFLGDQEFGSITIVAEGGLGDSTYNFSVVPGNDLLSDSSLLEHSAEFPLDGIKYQLSPAAAYSVNSIKRVTVQVISGSQIASDSFFVTAPVKIKEGNHISIVDGNDAKIIALEGDPDGVYEIEIDSNSGARAEILATEENNTFFINATESTNSNPLTPDVIDVKITSLNSSYSTNVLVYAAPFVEYQLGEGEVFKPSESSYRTELDQTNLLSIHLSGGTGEATFEIVKTDLEGSSGNILSYKGITYDKDSTLDLEYGGTPPVVKIHPGNRSGSITFKVVSGGATLIREVRFQAFTIQPNEFVMDSNDSISLEISKIGVPPYTWTMINSNIGKGFVKSVGSQNFSTSITTSSINESLYFYSDETDDEMVGFIQVEDSVGNVATATVTVNQSENEGGGVVDDEEENEPDEPVVGEEPREPTGTNQRGDETIFSNTALESSGGCLLRRYKKVR